ncbi:hypothetical protein ON010_g13483 [Phytophthora cinnamomi]|nr:hypothetical protein ON010_g13483 [Phytophthora cinnamomi]
MKLFMILEPSCQETALEVKRATQPLALSSRDLLQTRSSSLIIISQLSGENGLASALFRRVTVIIFKKIFLDENPTTTIETAKKAKDNPRKAAASAGFGERIELCTTTTTGAASALTSTSTDTPQQQQQQQQQQRSQIPAADRQVNKRMTITHSVQQEFLDDESKSLICIPCRPSSTSTHSSPLASAALQSRGPPTVIGRSAPTISTTTPPSLLQVPLPPLPTPSTSPTRTAESTKGERWTEDEHERFLLGMEMFKAGPWKKIAGVVGTRDARQTMSHAQKYRQKIKRRKLGLPTPEYPRRVDHGIVTASSTAKRMRTAVTTEAAPTGESRAADPVARTAGSRHVSPGGQLPREALDERARVTAGLIPAETMHAIRAVADNVGSGARTPDRAVVGANIGREDTRAQPQSLDAALEPLDANVLVVQDSWLGPDELWEFLDGRAASGPDVAGDAEAQPCLREAGYQ